MVAEIRGGDLLCGAGNNQNPINIGKTKGEKKKCRKQLQIRARKQITMQNRSKKEYQSRPENNRLKKAKNKKEEVGAA